MTVCLDCVLREHGPLPSEWNPLIELLCASYQSCEGAAIGLRRHTVFENVLDELKAKLGTELSVEQRNSAFRLFKSGNDSTKILARWNKSPPRKSVAASPTLSDPFSVALRAADDRQDSRSAQWVTWHGEIKEFLASLSSETPEARELATDMLFVGDMLSDIAKALADWRKVHPVAKDKGMTPGSSK